MQEEQEAQKEQDIQKGQAKQEAQAVPAKQEKQEEQVVSAKQEKQEDPAKQEKKAKPRKKGMPAAVKLILATLTPFILTAIIFYVYGMQIQNDDSIFPNISVAGTDVSGFTRAQAFQALDIQKYDERIAGVKVTLILPDGSQLVVGGADAGLRHNAYEMVNEAYSIGRGRGVVQDAVSHLQRIKADGISFDIDFALDAELLNEKVASFIEIYNSKLRKSEPQVYEDRVVFTKGAGRVSADTLGLCEIVYNSVFESLDIESPVKIQYALPETRGFEDDILALRNSIYIQVVSSEFDRDTNSATESVTGVDFDPIAAAVLVSGIESGKTATFMLEYTQPDCTQEYLESLLFRDLLAERMTWAGGAPGRIGNIELACSAINGLVLLPGEEFSFNETVGERTVERGFKIAPTLARGELVPGIGGGICQVSSTIHAAIKPTALQITEARKHGKPVAYLPWGWDATVDWGNIDFKFLNNTDYPIRIEVGLVDRQLTARVYGTIIDDFPTPAPAGAG